MPFSYGTRYPTTPQEAALLDALLRDIRVRQSMVKAALEDDEDTWRAGAGWS